jgi:hypothetical protein
MSNGVILYEGPSVLDGAPIVAILTGTERLSVNAKTGPMMQTWILCQDAPPLDAARSGADASICGECPLRGPGDGSLKGRRCYVQTERAPGNVWRTWRAGRYDTLAPGDGLTGEGTGRRIRLGAYGDPAAVPYSVWHWLTFAAVGHTGYTHQWRHPRFDVRLLDLCMASCDSELDVHALLCWYPEARWFRVRAPGQALLLPGEVQCPATPEGGNRSSCDRCGLCAGSSVLAKSVSLDAHGSGRFGWVA